MATAQARHAAQRLHDRHAPPGARVAAVTRIIAGLAKGRRLAVPPTGTRPTSDRAREGLFNSLAAAIDLDGARVLDLYAGSGAVGLEALSRGAASATLVESNRRAVAVLRRNVDTVDLPGATVVAAPVARYLSDAAGEFDLIFADPPYAEAEKQLPGVAEAAQQRLATDGVIVFEAPATLRPIELSGVTWTGEKRYGETRFWYGRPR